MRIRLLGQHLRLSLVVLVSIDAALFYLAFVGAALARLGWDIGSIQQHQGPLWPRALLFCAALAGCFLAFGLYSARQRARAGGIFIRVIAAVAVGVVLTALAFYLVPYLWIGRGVLALAAIGVAALAIGVRLGWGRFVGTTAFKTRILVYGTGRGAATISGLRRRSDQRGFFVVGFVQPSGESLDVPAERVIEPQSTLLELCNSLNVDEIVVAMDDRRRQFPIAAMLECRLAGIDVTELPTFLERETGRVRLDVVSPSWLIFGEGFNRGSFRLFTTATIDVIASLLILAAALPLVLVTIVAIKVEDGWYAPVFYSQKRVGVGGRQFKLLKFRSMRIDAESDGKARWAQANDTRVTRVGSVIRKLRIDELPQIVNVMLGDMCFVGPRPERPQFVAALAEKIPYYLQRHCVKPGITGWAQLCYPYGSSEQDAIEKLQYDLYYIKNNCLLLDLAILLQTAEVVLLGKGAR